MKDEPGKRPSFQFYPADWQKDPALSACSLEAKGLWITILCIGHQSEEYGFLILNGAPMRTDQLSRMAGESQRLVTKLLSELETAGVFSRDDRGAIYSRRMVKDERTRNARADGGKLGAEHGQKGAEHGAKGGRPRKARGDNKPPLELPLDPPPSSSSSSSSSNVPPNPLRGDAEGEHVLPKGWQGLTITQRKQVRVNTNSKAMNRIGKLLGRRDGTLWSVAEAVALKTVKPAPDEIELLEAYYLAEIDKEKDIRRKDLLTLFNNWTGELDRARIFKSSL